MPLLTILKKNQESIPNHDSLSSKIDNAEYNERAFLAFFPEQWPLIIRGETLR